MRVDSLISLIITKQAVAKNMDGEVLTFQLCFAINLMLKVMNQYSRAYQLYITYLNTHVQNCPVIFKNKLLFLCRMIEFV